MNENEHENENREITLEDLRDSYAFGADGGESGYSEQPTGSEASQTSQAGNPDESLPAAEAVTAQAAAGGSTAEGSAEAGNRAESDVSERYGAAMRLSEKDEQLRTLASENAALKAELESARQMAAQSAGEANAEVAKQLSGDDEFPVFDEESYNFASDGERREMMTNYSRALVDYAVKKAQADVLNRVAPLMDEYDRTVENAAFEKALGELSASEEFADVKDYGGDIRRLCEREEFSSLKPYQRVTLAALVARGLHAGSPAAKEKPDIGVQADEVLANEALMKEIELRKARSLNERRGDYPTQVASGGLSAAAYMPPKKAQSIEELRGMYGF